MLRTIPITAAALLLYAGAASAQPQTRSFSAASADATPIHGQADIPENPRGAVVMVAGTGLFDRDVRFGRSGAPRDLLFADIARRLNARGMSAVRYDRRGVRHGAAPPEMLDTAISATSTTTTQRDDLAAVYNWARDARGIGGRCIVLFGHSEGMLHIGRLAANGAPAPRAVIGVGALLESPRSGVQWQMTERDAYSLRLMDADGDGHVTNQEVEANLRNTPSSFADSMGPFLQPDGQWTADEIAEVSAVQTELYTQARDAALARPDDAPYPNATTPMARYSWWKSWFTDETPVAAMLTRWRRPMIFHYGAIDSQTNAERQSAAAAVLGDRATIVVHARRGHSLGEHALFGPMDEALAERIADEAAAACD